MLDTSHRVALETPTLRVWLLTDTPDSRRQAAWGRAYRRWLQFRSNPLAMIGLVTVTVLVLAAVAVMAAAVWPLSGRLPPLPELLLQAALGAAVYGGLMLAFDVARCRTLLRLWLAMRKRGA